jgi:hypothetical protein
MSISIQCPKGVFLVHDIANSLLITKFEKKNFKHSLITTINHLIKKEGGEGESK